MRFFLIVALIPSLTFATPTHRPSPTPTPVPKGPVEKAGMVCRSKQQDLELRDWINGLIGQVHAAQAETTAAVKSEAATKAALISSQTDATNLANECAADKACAKAPLSCWFHRLLKHIFWFAGGLIVVLIIVAVVAPGAMKFIMGVLNFFLSWVVALFKPRPPTP